jgi:hypothetical protein
MSQSIELEIENKNSNHNHTNINERYEPKVVLLTGGAGFM